MQLESERQEESKDGDQMGPDPSSQMLKMLKSSLTGKLVDSSEQLKPRVSVFGTVRRLREQRLNMVKNQQQYVFLYTYMNMWIKHDLVNGANPDDIRFDFSAQG